MGDQTRRSGGPRIRHLGAAPGAGRLTGECVGKLSVLEQPCRLEWTVAGWATLQAWYLVERLQRGQMRTRLAKPRAMAVGPSRRHPPTPSSIVPSDPKSTTVP